MKEKTFYVGIGYDDQYDKDNRTLTDRIYNTVIEGVCELVDDEVGEGSLYWGDRLKFEVKVTYEPEDK